MNCNPIPSLIPNTVSRAIICCNVIWELVVGSNWVSYTPYSRSQMKLLLSHWSQDVLLLVGLLGKITSSGQDTRFNSNWAARSPRCSDYNTLSFLIYPCHPLSLAPSGETVAYTLLARLVGPHADCEPKNQWSHTAVMVFSVKDMVSVSVTDESATLPGVYCVCRPRDLFLLDLITNCFHLSLAEIKSCNHYCNTT